MFYVSCAVYVQRGIVWGQTRAYTVLIMGLKFASAAVKTRSPSIVVGRFGLIGSVGGRFPKDLNALKWKSCD